MASVRQPRLWCRVAMVAAQGHTTRERIQQPLFLFLRSNDNGKGTDTDTDSHSFV